MRGLVLLACLALTPAALAAPPALPEVAEADWVEGPDGLRLVDLAAGEGPAWTEGVQGRVDMTVWNADGEVVFHSDEAGGAVPITPGSGAFIQGVELALLGLKPGGRRLAHVPAALAYGEDPPEGAPVGAVTVLLERVDTPAPPVVREPPAAPAEVPDSAWQEQPNGMRLADLVVGEGPAADKGQTVTVEYTGWLVEDTSITFDSSYNRPQPFQFTLGAGEVILGWDKGVRGMQVGGTRMLEIPAYMAYGSQARGKIPAHAPLLFQVELKAIEGP